MFYFVTYTHDFGTYGREFPTREEAEAFAASLVGTDAADVVVETHDGGWDSDESDTRPDAAGEMVEVQLGPALT